MKKVESGGCGAAFADLLVEGFGDPYNLRGFVMFFEFKKEEIMSNLKDLKFDDRLNIGEMNNNLSILKNVIISNTKQGHSRVDIRIENGKIRELKIIEKNCSNFSANDFFVTPGFINAHLHPNQLLDRRLLDNLNTHSLLNRMHANFKKTYEDRHVQALFVLMDAIKSGATTICSVASNPMPVIDAYKKIGVKGSVSCFFNDQWETSDKAPKVVDMNSIEESFAELITHKTEKLDIHIGTASIRSASNDLLVFLNTLAKKYNSKVWMHLSECPEDIEVCKEKRGTTPIRLLEKLNVLNSFWSLIHTVAIDEEEIEILAKNNVSIIHCPVSNAKTGAGIAPIDKLMKAGVNITLGTDACSNNNTNNILNEAYFASLLYSSKNRDPQTVTNDRLLKWLTVNGYKMLGKSQTGSIEEGQSADLLLWELKRGVFFPLCYGNFYSSLFYNAPDIKPHTVLVDGETVVENYKITKLCEEEIKESVNKSGKKIFQNIHIFESSEI